MAMALSLDKKVFHETEGAIVRGEYSTPNGPRKFLASRGVQEDVDYYPAEDVEELLAEAAERLAGKLGERCSIAVRKQDMLEAALAVQAQRSDTGAAGALPVLVLNFANPFSAGGNALIGAHTQEGELCRRSTLFASISSREARPFYDANTDLGGSVYTDGVLVSPHVEVFRHVGYLTMDAPVVVAALSSPAPYAKALQDMSENDLFGVLKARIMGALAVAADAGYRHLVLGAWGCGSNGNDPRLVARAFREALDAPLSASAYANLFDTVTFAVLDPADGAPVHAAFQAEFDA